MSRRRLLPLAAAVAGAAALVLAAGGFAFRAADNPVLTGDVGAGDGFTIALADATGAPVKHVDPGTYTIVVHDHSAIHNFHLLGPGGVDQSTTVPETGDATWTVTLVDGTYTFRCDPHAAGGMKGTFTVGNPSPPARTARISAHVGPGRSIGVVGALAVAPGKAVITVVDRSRTDDFHLVGPGVNRATGVAFRGTVRWTVTLAAGTYRFRSDRHPSLKGTFLVSAAAADGSSAGGYGLGGYGGY